MSTIEDDTLTTCAEAFSADTEAKFILGFDGFLDIIFEMVDSRHDETEYNRIESLRALGDRIITSANQNSSQTIEWVPQSTGPGGYTVHCGKALRTLGADIEMIGTFGRPIVESFIDPFDHDNLYSVGEPTETHAVEFADAKLILINSKTQLSLDWSQLIDQLPKSQLVSMIDGCSVLGVGTWGKISNIPSIWNGLQEEVFPQLEDPPAHLVMDVGNVRLLDGDELVDGGTQLSQLDKSVPVTVSGNRGEINYLAEQLCEAPSESFLDAVADVRESLGVHRVIGHNAEQVVLSSNDETASICTPIIENPSKLLSAGDKFNAGIIYGLYSGLRAHALLLAGDLVAGFFVEYGRPPTTNEVCNRLYELFHIENN